MAPKDQDDPRSQRRRELGKWSEKQIVNYWRILMKRSGRPISSKSKPVERMRNEIIAYEFPQSRAE